MQLQQVVYVYIPRILSLTLSVALEINQASTQLEILFKSVRDKPSRLLYICKVWPPSLMESLTHTGHDYQV